MHCRKVAGSSIAATLAPHLGSDDLHLGTWPEALAVGVAPNRRARRVSYFGRLLRKPRRLAEQKYRVAALNGAQRMKYRTALGASPEHAHARCVRDFDPGAWRDYFKFAFVRNPYDRAVSDFHWRTRKTGRTDLDFDDFLARMQARDFRDGVVPRHFDNWPIYTIDDRIAVDFVGRFESLADDLAQVFDRIGLPAPRLPHAKSSKPRRPTASWYGDTQRARVESLFGREIRAFDYAFPA